MLWLAADAFWLEAEPQAHLPRKLMLAGLRKMRHRGQPQGGLVVYPNPGGLLLGSTGEAVGGRGMPPGSHAQPAANTKTQQKDSLAEDSIVYRSSRLCSFTEHALDLYLNVFFEPQDFPLGLKII